MEGYVKLHRLLLGWQWYSSANHLRVFLHFLLSANHKESKWRSETILKGQLITGLFSLSDALCLSIQEIRTVLKDLKKSGEITVRPTNKYSVITITCWDKYQLSEPKLTNEQQTNNKRTTTNKNVKNVKNVRKNIYRAEALRVLNFLNEKANRNFQDSLTSLVFIEARLKDLNINYKKTIEESSVLMRKVISLKCQNDFFIKNNFVRPSTLFNKTNFDNYLEEVITYEKSGE